jgi:P-type Ca2+ transporter type 2C
MESAAISAGALGAYGYGLLRYGSGLSAGTIAFNSLTIGQLLHTWSCRSEKHSIFSPGTLPPNRYLNWALTGSLLFQGLAMAIPWLRNLLRLAPIGFIDSLVIGASALLPLLVNEATKTLELTGPETKPPMTFPDS